MKKLLKHFPLSKVLEHPDGSVTAYGLVTAEVPDSDHEICDYEFAKNAYTTWSSEAFDSTTAAGQDSSYGNIRLMHVGTIAGKATAPPVFLDDLKEIHLATVTATGDAARLLKGGFIRGFSQGGDYAFRKCNVCATAIPEGNECPVCKKTVDVRYGPIIAEVSYVDSPSLKKATFSLVKADGSQQLVKFAERTIEMAAPAAVVPALPAGIDLDALTARITKSVVDSLATAGAEKKTAAKTAKCAKAAHAALEKAGTKLNLKKDLWDVARFAGVLQDVANLQWSARYEAEYERDDSEIPAQLGEDLATLAETFLAWSEEEVKELTASAAAIQKLAKGANSNMTQLEKSKSLTAHIAKMKECVGDHCDKFTKAIASHKTAMNDHCDKIAKMAGGGEDEPEKKAAGEGDGKAATGDGASEAINIQSAGTQSDYGKAVAPDGYSFTKAEDGTLSLVKSGPETFTKAQVQTIAQAAVNEALTEFVKALSSSEDPEEDDDDGEKKPKGKAKKVAPAAGIGNRGEALAAGGPQIRVMPVSKAQDGVALPAPGATPAADAPVDVATMKKVMGGDRTAQLAFMKSAGVAHEVPQTIVEAMSR